MFRSKNWLFTLFVAHDSMEEALTGELKAIYDKQGVNYIVGQLEICPTTGKRHIQGYLELSGPMRFTRLKDTYFTPQAHLEPRRGTQKQAIDYCTKEDTRVKDTNPIKLGTVTTNQGARTDITDAFDAIKDGMNERDYYINHTVVACRYPRMFTRVHMLFGPRRDDTIEPFIFWIMGPTRTGKTRVSRHLTRNFTLFTKHNASKWWDGYCNEQIVLVDDFSDNIKDLDIAFWNAVFDRYPCPVETKGGMMQLTTSFFIVTCCRHPSCCFMNEDNQQLVERATVIDVEKILHLLNSDSPQTLDELKNILMQYIN